MENVGLLELGAAALAVVVSVVAFVAGELRSRDSFRVAWTKDVLQWAQSCVGTVAEMEHEFQTASGRKLNRKLEPSVRVERLARLSSLIDEGRFFFENYRHTEWGKRNPAAYRGFRPKLLDSLVCIYDEYERALGGEDFDIDRMHAEKRQFVSMVQELVDPRWFARKAAAAVKKVEVTG